MARYEPRRVTAAQVAGTTARCVQVGAISREQALVDIRQILTGAGHRPGGDAAKAVLTLACETYAVDNPGPGRWYYQAAVALLVEAGADEEAARKARRDRSGARPTVG